MQFPGGLRVSDTAKTKSFWTLSRASIYWYVYRIQPAIRETNCAQVNANGNVVRSEILGAVKMKCYLSGMPELRLGLNDKVMFESTGRSEPTIP
jgi:hypothetical protein